MKPDNPNIGLLLIDGARYADAMGWLHEHYGSDNPQSLFNGTAYQRIGEVGPFLLNASLGSPAHTAWWSGADLQHGVWLATDKTIQQLLPILQRRLRIVDEQQQEFWLRLADGPALLRTWLTGAQWPKGFWFGVESFWLRHGNGAVCAWENQHPQYDSAPQASGLTAQITLSESLLLALSLPANPETKS